MVDLGSSGRVGPVRLVFLLALTAAVGSAQPQGIPASWLVNFPSSNAGNVTQSAAVAVADGGSLVVVLASGAQPENPTLLLAGRPAAVHLIGYDAVSRLGFVKPDGDLRPLATKWADEAGASATAPLLSMEAGGAVKCRGAGWIKQVGGKVLPFALLRVNFTKALPPAGTPIASEAGKIVGLFFQSADDNHSGYAIPAEAVHRVHRDISAGGRLVRGWIGLALHAESPSPLVSRVVPDSPAAKAGILANDIVVKIGARMISDYADAANAFFYLVPGQPVNVKLRRGTQLLDFSVTPAPPQG